ncbi:MAG: hypothetical protein V1489_02600 [Candidatus Liptonbacteria bacterium]
MTILQPERPWTLTSYLLGGLIVVMACTSFWLITMYVRVVDLEHDMAQAKVDIQTREAENATLRDKMYALFGADNMRALSESRQLITDRNPQYVKIDREWSLASQY